MVPKTLKERSFETASVGLSILLIEALCACSSGAQNVQTQVEAPPSAPQSQGKDINLPFVNIHIGHGLSIDAPFTHVDKMPGMPVNVNAPYSNVQSSLDPSGTHVRAPYANVDSPDSYRGEAVHVRAPYAHVDEPRAATAQPVTAGGMR
jgi:hypothetical protein